MTEFKHYIGTKSLRAKPMTRGEYCKYRNWELPANEDQADEGYLVEYDDGGKPNDPRHEGYISWSPADVFEKSYRLTQGLTFGEAIEAMKLGKRVARKGWNGKGMYIWLVERTIISGPARYLSPRLDKIAQDNGGALEFLGSIRMWTADKKVLTGWLASQTDMLSEDWTILED